MYKRFLPLIHTSKWNKAVNDYMFPIPSASAMPVMSVPLDSRWTALNALSVLDNLTNEKPTWTPSCLRQNKIS